MSKAIDLSKILTRAHEEKWVALSGNYKKVVGYSENLVDLKKRIEKTKEEVVYMKVPSSDRCYAQFS